RGLTSLRSIFLEKNPAIFWHSGQMFPGTLMQTEFYRDLVTPIDPTSRFSFLNYLKSNGRLDQFFCSSTIYPTRREFEDYFNNADRGTHACSLNALQRVPTAMRRTFAIFTAPVSSLLRAGRINQHPSSDC